MAEPRDDPADLITPMSQHSGVVELRMRRSWRIFVWLAVPALAAVMVLGTADTLSGREVTLTEILTAIFIVGVLGGLIVVPGTALLVRQARGVPDVRFDERGVVWGRDRARDLAIDWADVERVISKKQETQYLTDRVFVLRPRPGASGTAATTVFGRVLGAMNRLTYGSPYTISSLVADRPWEEIRRLLAAYLPDRPFELA